MHQLPKAIRNILPYKIHSHILKNNNSLAYLDEGHGEVILCLHGNPTWSFYYRNIIGHFKKDYRVIALDNIGMGLSGRSHSRTTLKDHVENAFSLLNALDIKRITLIGHDWGGAIATSVAVLAKQKNIKVQKVILMNTAAFCDKNIPWQISICRWPFIGHFLVRALNLFAWPALYMASHKGLPKDVKKAMIYPYLNYKTRDGVHNFVRDIPMEKDHPTKPYLDAIEQSIPSLDFPFLFIWGGKDFCFNKHFYDRWKLLRPKDRFIYLGNAGHYVLEDEAEEVCTHIATFLNHDDEDKLQLKTPISNDRHSDLRV